MVIFFKGRLGVSGLPQGSDVVGNFLDPRPRVVGTSEGHLAPHVDVLVQVLALQIVRVLVVLRIRHRGVAGFIRTGEVGGIVERPVVVGSAGGSSPRWPIHLHPPVLAKRGPQQTGAGPRRRRALSCASSWAWS
jgi:hypothetical protein